MTPDKTTKTHRSRTIGECYPASCIPLLHMVTVAACWKRSPSDEHYDNLKTVSKPISTASTCAREGACSGSRSVGGCPPVLDPA